MPASWPHGDASLYQSAPDRARCYLQLFGDPIGRPPLGVELRGPVDIVRPECPAIPLRDAMAPDVPEDRRPIHPERRRQLLHRETPTVRGNQLGYLVHCKASLHRERPNERIGRVDGGLTGTPPKYRPERRQLECGAIYLRQRATSGRRTWSCTVTR